MFDDVVRYEKPEYATLSFFKDADTPKKILRANLMCRRFYDINQFMSTKDYRKIIHESGFVTIRCLQKLISLEEMNDLKIQTHIHELAKEFDNLSYDATSAKIQARSKTISLFNRLDVLRDANTFKSGKTDRNKQYTYSVLYFAASLQKSKPVTYNSMMRMNNIIDGLDKIIKKDGLQEAISAEAEVQLIRKELSTFSEFVDTAISIAEENSQALFTMFRNIITSHFTIKNASYFDEQMFSELEPYKREFIDLIEQRALNRARDIYGS